MIVDIRYQQQLDYYKDQQNFMICLGLNYKNDVKFKNYCLRLFKGRFLIENAPVDFIKLPNSNVYYVLRNERVSMQKIISHVATNDKLVETIVCSNFDLDMLKSIENNTMNCVYLQLSLKYFSKENYDYHEFKCFCDIEYSKTYLEDPLELECLFTNYQLFLTMNSIQFDENEFVSLKKFPADRMLSFYSGTDNVVSPIIERNTLNLFYPASQNSLVQSFYSDICEAFIAFVGKHLKSTTNLKDGHVIANLLFKNITNRIKSQR